MNLYIAQALVDPLHKLPSEYLALGVLPAPWTITDSIGFATVAIGIYGTNGGGEVGNAALLLDLMDRLGAQAGRAAFDDLYWVEDPEIAQHLARRTPVWQPPVSPRSGR